MTYKGTVIVIGSGIAGIATSIRLAIEGWNVTVFEKNSYVGGKLSSFNNQGYQFDAGPSLFTQPQYIEDLFALANEDITAYFAYTQSPISCKYFFNDGSQLEAYANPELLADSLCSKFGEKKAKVLQYLKNSKTAFENIGILFTTRNLHSPDTYKGGRLRKALAATKLSYLTKSLHNYNKNYFKHPNTVQLFDRFATYNGSNPYKAPAMLSMIPHFEINVGTYYPLGGMISITNALYKLAQKKGVTFFTNTEVEEILIAEKKAIGVKANGNTFSADIVISNMDVYFTYKKLLQNQIAASNILKQERSSSAFIFYWGVKKIFPQLKLHNIFFSKDYEQEFYNIFTDGTLANDITVYINITSKMELSQAPANCENWFVMVNAPAHRQHNWEALQPKIKSAIIGILEKHLGINIGLFIETENILTPKDIEYTTASYMGSLYGTSSNSKTAAFMRQRNKSKEIDNLYFVGGSVHPGGGIPLCLGSAKIVSELINQT